MKRQSAAQAQVVLSLGKQGSGKTTLALNLLKGHRRVLLHDPNGEAALAKGAEVVTTKRGLVDLCGFTGPIRICWRGYSAMPLREAFDFGNRCAWAGENMTVFWDEADKLTHGRLDPESAAYNILNSGRHRRLQLFATSRRPARVPADLTALATRICCFKLTGEHDLKYMRRYVQDAAAMLPHLGQYEYIDWQEEFSGIKKSDPP